jgi:hypothetical protein
MVGGIAKSWRRRVALLVWELPQNVLGVANLARLAARRRVERVGLERERVMIEIREGAAAVSLGAFVFFSKHDNPFVPVGPENRDHEYGHSIQSRLLGPLYLPLVGVPSSARAVYAVVHRSVTGRRWSRYYDGYPESWADRLGGVNPTLRPRP